MESSISSLLASLQSSLESAALPDAFDIAPPPNGISLLDLKNELFLSYLQNLVFLILIKLRHTTSKDNDKSNTSSLNDEVTKKLAELRHYIEKGVKPLEGKLKYQIDKVVKAAEDASRAESQKPNGVSKKDKKEKKRRADESEDSERSSASEGETDDDASASESEIDELSYRPNPAALMRPDASKDEERKQDEPADGVYRPPRITATAMPTTRGKEEKPERKQKSGTLDEFIAEEMSTAPLAEPSIGSTIMQGGRRNKTQRERDEEDERTRYEETHMTRLPKVSEKKKGQRGGRDRGGFGGEDFRDLNAGLDRIGGLVRKKEGGGGKRKWDSAGLGGGGGGDVGSAFAKRKKAVMRRMR